VDAHNISFARLMQMFVPLDVREFLSRNFMCIVRCRAAAESRARCENVHGNSQLTDRSEDCNPILNGFRSDIAKRMLTPRGRH
jgi:hypothetical protein